MTSFLEGFEFGENLEELTCQSSLRLVEIIYITDGWKVASLIHDLDVMKVSTSLDIGL